jgi:hypothetical protein
MTCNKVEAPKYVSATNDHHHHSPKPKPPAKIATKPLSAPTSSLPRSGTINEHLRQAPRQAMVPVRQQRHSLPMAQSMADNLTSERLNAAIEMEVARRLKERITAAALSRHALAMMQQQVIPSAASLPILRDSSGLGWNSAAAAAALHRQASNQMASLNLNPLMLAKGRPMLHHPGAGMMGLRMPNSMGAMPTKRDVVAAFQSNIEGAKTA